MRIINNFILLLESCHFAWKRNKIKIQPPRIENQIYSSQVNCFTNQASSVMIITKQYFMSLLMILSFHRILYSKIRFSHKIVKVDWKNSCYKIFSSISAAKKNYFCGVKIIYFFYWRQLVVGTPDEFAIEGSSPPWGWNIISLSKACSIIISGLLSPSSS